jgi:hypothetical protein
MKIEKPATCISVYRDAFEPDMAQAFINMLNEEIENEWSELGWGSSGVGQGTVTQYRTSLSCSLVPLMKPYPETDLSKFFNRTIRDQISEVSEDYRKEYLIANAIFEPYSVLKYLPEAEYHGHYDHFRDNARVFSMVANLVSPESGGSLEFPMFDTTVECEAGTVIMFPSNFPYLHIAHPVVSGTKYSLVTWFR